MTVNRMEIYTSFGRVTEVDVTHVKKTTTHKEQAEMSAKLSTCGIPGRFRITQSHGDWTIVYHHADGTQQVESSTSFTRLLENILKPHGIVVVDRWKVGR